MNKLSTVIRRITAISIFLGAGLYGTGALAITHYDVLGVSPTASEAEIKLAYRKLAQKTHPDRFTGQSPEIIKQKETQFKALNEAHSVLSDSQKRFAYDQKIGTNKVNSIDSVEKLIENLEGFGNMSIEELVFRLGNLNELFSDLVNSENTDLYRRYRQVIDKIANVPRFANMSIVKSLIHLEVRQGLFLNI